MNFSPIRLVPELLLRSVEKYPEKTALICNDSHLNFHGIEKYSNRFANCLKEFSILKNERVVVHLPNCIETVISIWGSMKINSIAAVIGVIDKIERVVKILNDCAATVFVTDESFILSLAQYLYRLKSLKLIVYRGGNASENYTEIVTERLGIINFSEIKREFEPKPPILSTIDLDIAYLVYTSGSTGAPRGVMTTHRSSLFGVENVVNYLGMNDEDRVLSVLSLAYGYGFHQLLFATKVGGTLVLEDSFAFPASILKKMASERITGFPSMPTMLNMMMDLNLNKYNLDHLRFITSTGAPLPRKLIQAIAEGLKHVRLHYMYSLTEAVYPIVQDPELITENYESVGRVMPGTEAWLENEKGERVGPNQVGELILRGSHVRSGYWKNPEATGRRFSGGPYPGEIVCRTGDLFTMDEDNYFYYVGRNDQMIKSGGQKVSPRVVEDVLYNLDGIAEAAAVGLPDPLMGQVIKAFVVLSPEKEKVLRVEDILEHCRLNLEDFMVPKAIEVRRSLPKTTSGKIKINALI